MLLLLLLLSLFCMKDSMNEPDPNPNPDPDPEYGLGILHLCILLYADTSNNTVTAIRSTRNHTLCSIDLQKMLNAFMMC
jgi:hypothetical protein